MGLNSYSGVHDRRIFLTELSKVLTQMWKNENKYLENQLEQSDDRVPLPMNLFARLAFQWPD